MFTVPGNRDIELPRKKESILRWAQEITRRVNRRIHGDMVVETSSDILIRTPEPPEDIPPVRRLDYWWNFQTTDTSVAITGKSPTTAVADPDTFTAGSGVINVIQPGMYLGLLCVCAGQFGKHDFAVDSSANDAIQFSAAVTLGGTAFVNGDQFGTGDLGGGGAQAHAHRIVNDISVTIPAGALVAGTVPTADYKIALPTLGNYAAFGDLSWCGTFIAPAGTNATTPLTLSLVYTSGAFDNSGDPFSNPNATVQVKLVLIQLCPDPSQFATASS